MIFQLKHADMCMGKTVHIIITCKWNGTFLSKSDAGMLGAPAMDNKFTILK